MMRAFPLWKVMTLLVTIPLVVFFDQWTKIIILNRFHYGESLSVIDSFFALTYVRNMGAAFGVLHNSPAYFREPFFILVPVLALIILITVLAKLKGNLLAAIAISMIMGGAIGNLIDRVRLGFVVDFLDFHWKEVYHWPAFNVADSCIVVGVGYLFIHSFFEENSTQDAGSLNP